MGYTLNGLVNVMDDFCKRREGVIDMRLKIQFWIICDFFFFFFFVVVVVVFLHKLKRFSLWHALGHISRQQNDGTFLFIARN